MDNDSQSNLDLLSRIEQVYLSISSPYFPHQAIRNLVDIAADSMEVLATMDPNNPEAEKERFERNMAAYFELLDVCSERVILRFNSHVALRLSFRLFFSISCHSTLAQPSARIQFSKPPPTFPPPTIICEIHFHFRKFRCD